MNGETPSPVVEAYDALRSLNARWSVDVGTPTAPGWIAGADLRTAASGPFHALLLGSASAPGRRPADHRGLLCPSLRLGVGNCSGAVLATLRARRCPREPLVQGHPSTFLERTAMYVPRGV